MTARILLTHTPEMRRNYYGEDALAGLAKLGEVILHEADEPLDAAGLVRAAEGCRLIVSDRNTPGYGEAFDKLPDLEAFLRVAVDIRNVDVASASRAGVLVTHAGRSWVPAVSELVIGHMINIARGISNAVAAYRRGESAPAILGRQLNGSTAGIIGYGPLGRNVADLALVLGMKVLVHDPYVKVERAGIEQVSLDDLVRRSDFVVPLAVATAETENLIGEKDGEGKGFYLQMGGFAAGRLQTGGRACGLAQAALETTATYAGERKQFGRPIGDFQLTQYKLGRMATHLTAARQLTYAAARAMDADETVALEPAMAKLFASDVAVWVTQEGQLVHGGWGYAEEFAISRHVVDALVLPIFEGVKPILELKVVGRSLLAD